MLPIKGQIANFEHFRGLIRQFKDDGAEQDSWVDLRALINKCRVYYLVSAQQCNDLLAEIPAP